MRGRIRIDAGPSDDKIQRFGPIDRFAHWLMAGSFVVLYHWIKPIVRPSRVDTNFWERGFSTITTIGKFAHNYLAFAFMAGPCLIFCVVGAP